MERTPIKSSQIKSVGYDELTREMQVEFNSGSVYSYSGVEPETFQGMLSAESAGRYFGQNIKSNPQKYKYQRVDEKKQN